MARSRPATYVIYIPGLGDGADGSRRWALKLWRLLGVHAELVPMMWYDGKPFAEKLQRVTAAIDAAEKAGYTVSLIGESAGGSMAINAAAAHPGIHRLVTIAGVNDPSIQISPVIQAKSPAFMSSVAKLSDSLPQLRKHDVHTVRALLDLVVDKRFSRIPDVRDHRVPSLGHLPTIALCLTIFSPYVISLITRRR